MIKILVVFLLSFNIIFAQKQTIKLITDDSFPPYSYMQDNKIVGLDIDIINEIENRLNIEIEITAFPWSRSLMMVKRGLVDGAFALFKTPEREKWGIYSASPLHFSSYHVFTNKGSEFEFNDISDLIGKKIGINRSFAISDDFDTMKKNNEIKVLEFEDDKINFLLLEKGRIDCYVGNYLTSVNQEYRKNFSMLPIPVVDQRSSYIIFSKKSTNININIIREQIDQVLIELHNDGTIDNLTQNYISK